MSLPAEIRKRILLLASLASLAAALTSCAGGWQRSADVTGYAACNQSNANLITVHYESGLGVDEVTPIVHERAGFVQIEVELRGSGSVPAIAEPATLEVELDHPVAGREVRDGSGAAVPIRACE